MTSSSKKHFINDVLTLSVVPLISQLVGLLLLPVITRIYSPSDFGLFNTFSAIVAFLGVFSTLAYHSSILLPKKDESASSILISCLFSSVLFSLFVLILIVFFYNKIILFFKIEDLEAYIFLIPIFIFLHGFFQTMRYWNSRIKNFKKIAQSKISEVISNKSFSIGYGLVVLNNVGGLIYSLLIASIIKNLFLLFSIKNLKYIFFNIQIEKIFTVLSKYKKFPIFSLPSELLSRVPALLIVFFVLNFFDSGLLGNYSLTISVLAVPTVFFTSSIIEAFSPRVAQAIHSNTHLKVLEEVYERIFSTTFLIFVVLIFFGDKLFSFVFGSSWIIAGVLAQILAIRSLFEVVTTPILSLTAIVQKQELNLIRRIAEISVTVVSFYFGSYFDNYIYTFILYSVLGSLSILIITKILMKQINLKFLTLFKRVKYYSKIISIIIISFIIFKFLKVESIFLNIIFLIITSSIYYYLVLKHDKELLNIIKSKLNLK